MRHFILKLLHKFGECGRTGKNNIWSCANCKFLRICTKLTGF